MTRNLACSIAIAALAISSLTAAHATAQEPELADPASVLEAPTPVIEPTGDAAPAPASAPVVAPLETTVVHQPVIAHAAAVCCPIEVVDSRVKLSARRLYRRGGPPVHVSVCVDNPVDCLSTLYEVPVCVPCCCVGQPRVCNARPGLLPGRGKVDLVWDCGFVATVTFLKHGGVIITYSAG